MRKTATIVLSLLILSLAGCTIGSGTVEETSEEFEQSVRKTYPVGSDEQLLIHDFTAKGYHFSTEHDGSRWLDKRSGLIWCDGRHQIRWHVDAAGKIKDVGASYGLICP